MDNSNALLFYKQRSRGKKIPPGGNTNDIFDMEIRQKEFFKEKKKDGVEDISVKNLRRSLSDCKLKPGDVKRTTPLATGKENAEIYKDMLKPKTILKGCDAIFDEMSVIDDEDPVGVGNGHRNPITGEGYSKLKDATNEIKNDIEDLPVKKEPRKPCIRIRQPPGGRSSIVL